MVAKALCRQVLGVQNLETQPDYLELKRLVDEKTDKTQIEHFCAPGSRLGEQTVHDVVYWWNQGRVC